MAQVLDTDIGQLLTSKAHLRTLDPGDQIVRFGTIREIIENATVGDMSGVHLEDRAGRRTWMYGSQNDPCDRVVGGRAGGVR